MNILLPISLAVLGSAVAAPAGTLPWVGYEDDTAGRLVADPSVGAADADEKDFAWADVDGDGDVDLVVVRKQPFTTTGRRRNVLLMNEGGVLVDRTTELAAASDVPGDLGFLEPTNDRDVVIVDVDADGWLDLVTAVTLSDDQPKHIGHPRVYMNLGADGGGTWQGFRHEDARIPQLFTVDGVAVNPRFNAVAAGDVNLDGFADLYFVDGDSGGASPGDLNDRLLLNDGTGVFTDVSAAAMTEEMLESSLGTAAAIVDMNGDGLNDVVKSSTLSAPHAISIAYNDWADAKAFSVFDPIYSFSPVFFTVDDLNGDALPDLVVTDDGTDRILLHQGNGPDGLAEFLAFALPDTTGFGGNSLVRDLDLDGDRDIVITDIDIEIAGCSRPTVFLRHDGSAPVPGFTEDPPGGLAEEAERTGTHDVAAIDLNGDGFLDLVLGRCAGLRIWMNVPPIGVVFEYPQGRPDIIEPGVGTLFPVVLAPFGGGVVEPGTALQHVSVDGGPFVVTPLLPLGDDTYEIAMPAVDCLSKVRWYLSAELAGGAVDTDPTDAPATTFGVVAANAVEVALVDEFEGDVSAWTVASEDLTSGAWEAADPNGTISGGSAAAPEDDATEGGVLAFVTENGVAGGTAGAADVDGGPTHLVSPVLDVGGGDARVSFARWFFCGDAGTPEADVLTVNVSNDDGATWTAVPSLTTEGTGGAWERVSFVVGDHVAPSETMRVRFSTRDLPNDSITEAGIDDFQVDRLLCVCTGDVDGDGEAAFGDLLLVLAAWGPCGALAEDLDGDGAVDFGDLLLVLAAWGGC